MQTTTGSLTREDRLSVGAFSSVSSIRNLALLSSHPLGVVLVCLVIIVLPTFYSLPKRDFSLLRVVSAQFQGRALFSPHRTLP